ncbi:hypothetical protein NAT47_05920 [Flavobacterium sp. HXWNR69]|uniref:Uncharacterized protein n=1 Tax=Flavobacterium fragile TaxID=2949085 RepID=A0ABT0TG74_9FLAO|nr:MULTISPECIES: hypothetical protein [unclassified Flavobacterium]MCL9769948.1 hypothetical protein [Flavobacterium sp. HXWNR69]MDD3005598.1 hypothetical protein [Flavobacterium sp.]
MKKVIVIFLLFIFTIQITKSFWIISSFHINRDYIAKNICINRFDKIPTCKGKCYLDSELSKEQKENQKSLLKIEKESFFVLSVLNGKESKRLIPTNSKKIVDSHKDIYYSSFLFKFENPPELA